eukprot:CAMPEP_0197081312 /NCGR_PEP_ID=MMETSP1384-20130603/214570_1 /TAXON_ID=29189 /ORGANISM="Ammonia sp." /LENGTH=559 /DNA_ID=CAMNT_0042520207 /DNA_START=479 /DNA_END=2158 /DNA_ORIENTATION=-
MAGIAYGANVDFSGALLYNEGEGKEGSLFGVAQTLIDDSVEKMDTIKGITLDIRDGIIFAVDGVQSILSDTSILGTGVSSLIATLNGIAALWGDYEITTVHNNQTYTFECVFCETISGTVSGITDEVSTQIGPIFEELNSTVNAIESTLVDTEATIIEHVDGFVDIIVDVRGQIQDADDEMIDIKSQIEQVNDQRQLAYNILFAIPLLPIVFILCGGILKKPICFTLSYICLWFSCSLMWLLLAVHLPIAVLLNDSCALLDVVESDVTAKVNNTAGEIFEACLTNEELTKTFGVDKYLNFTSQIEFPSLGDITSDFQFSELIAFEFTTFYTLGNEALVGINNLTTSSPFKPLGCCTWTRANVSTLNSTEFYPFNTSLWIALEDLKNVLGAESASINAFNDTIYKIRANLSAVTAQVQVIESDVQGVVDSVDNASLLLNPLFVLVDDMVDEARCGFIGDAYKDTKAVMCHGVLGSLARIVVAMFVIALLSMVGCLWTIGLVRKVEWFQLQRKDRKQQQLQQSFPTQNKPSVVVMQPLMQHGYAMQQNVAPVQPIFYNQSI